MKNKVKAILKQELDWAYVGLFVCAVFTACGIGLLITAVIGGAFRAVSSAIFVCAFVLAFWGFSIFLFIQCIKRLVPYYQSLKALKCGTNDTATICDYSIRAIRHGGRSNLPWNYKTYYSVTLRFLIDDKEVLYKTAYNYTVDQFKQLQEKPKIAIKRYKNTAVIVEEFYDKLDYKFSELPKKLRVNSILVVIMAWVSLALIIAGIISLCIFDYNKWAPAKWPLGLFISGIILIVISAILKSFIYVATENFVTKKLPYIRKSQKKAQKRERWKEMENNRK